MSIVKFSLGMPNKDLLGRDVMEQATKLMYESEVDDEALLNYGDDEGRLIYRESIAEWLSSEGDVVDSSQIFGTQGNSHGLASVTSMLTVNDVNSVIFIEQPVYMFAISVLKDHVAPERIIGIPFDNSGSIDLDELERQATVKAPTFLYFIPSFQNPTGVCMPGVKRKKLMEIARKFNFKLVCDDVYQTLQFAGEEPAPPSMAKLDTASPHTVISLGTFSKLLSPTLRCGWIRCRDSAVINRLANGGQVMSGGHPISSSIMTYALKSGSLQKHIDEKVRVILGRRCKAMCDTLDKYSDVVEFVRPTGGYFVWCKIPIKALELKEALKDQVTFWHGDAFMLEGAYSGFANHIRLSFAFFDVDTIQRGIDTLGSKIKELVA